MRSEVRIIQSQSEESREVNIDSYEAEQLLRKYGCNQHVSGIKPNKNVNKDLTFEEWVEMNDKTLKEEELRRKIAKPNTFDSYSGYDSEVRYSTDSDSGFSFRVEIKSDMKIPKY
jgi:hypothetical protein